MLLHRVGLYKQEASSYMPTLIIMLVSKVKTCLNDSSLTY